MTRIGVLSDTHLYSLDEEFAKDAAIAFMDCSIIFHAGDLTESHILDVFKGKKVYAVHGNMCSHHTRQVLPEHRTVTIDGFIFGLCHGAGLKANIEDRMIELFPVVDCIVYGHTHVPVCHHFGNTLLFNPGSFQSTGKYGSPGTYGIITVAEDGIKGKILERKLEGLI